MSKNNAPVAGKDLEIIINNEAQKYAHAQKVRIRDIKHLHGPTQLYYAFLAGVKFYKLITKN